VEPRDRVALVRADTLARALLDRLTLAAMRDQASLGRPAPAATRDQALLGRPAPVATPRMLVRRSTTAGVPMAAVATLADG